MSDNMALYKELITTSTEIAMATCVDNAPNVRLVSFVWDEKIPNVIYFSTDPDSNKIKEATANNNISFFTIDHKGPDSRAIHAQNATMAK